MSTAQYNPDIAPAAPMANEQQMYGDAEGNHNEVRYGNLRESHNIAPAPANHAPAPASAFISKEGEEIHKDTGMPGNFSGMPGNNNFSEASKPAPPMMAGDFSNEASKPAPPMMAGDFSNEASKPTPPVAAADTDAPIGNRNNSFSKSGEVAHKDFGMGASGNKDGKVASTSLQGRTYTSQSGLPPPPPSVLDTTPDMWFREHQGKLQAEETAQEEERLRALKQKKEESKGGIGYKVGKFFSNTSAAVGKSVNEVSDSTGAKAHESNMKQAKARLAKYWPGHNADQLIAEFDCEGLHYNMPIRGHVLLTPHSLLFMGKGKNELVIVEDIFLSDIVSYSKGVSVPCIEHGARWVMDLPNQIVQPDAIQIFTRNGMHFDFINISHSMKDFHDGHENVNVFDRFINYFDHAWRAAQI